MHLWLLLKAWNFLTNWAPLDSRQGLCSTELIPKQWCILHTHTHTHTHRQCRSVAWRVDQRRSRVRSDVTSAASHISLKFTQCFLPRRLTMSTDDRRSYKLDCQLRKHEERSGVGLPTSLVAVQNILQNCWRRGMFTQTRLLSDSVIKLRVPYAAGTALVD
jgi:hypothetical protein